MADNFPGMRPILLAAMLAAAGCSPPMMVDPEAPDYPPRAYRGYHCTTQSSCLDEQRCYRRFPNSDGYCVPMEYYETHDRGCKTDRDCTPTEICAEIAGAEFGRCEHRFEEKTQSK